MAQKKVARRARSAKTTKARSKTTAKTKTKKASKTKKARVKTAVKTAKKTARKAAKKTVKKAAKKTAKATKKTATKTKAVRKTRPEDSITLRIYDVHDVPEDKHFYFVNGHRVKNVKELAEIMDHIEREVFDYHVNEHRNDFYNWVAGVFEDLELAEKLLGVTGPKHLQFTIYKHVADKALKKR